MKLKSVMLLDHKADGTLVGQYRSIVGRDPNPRPLAGRAGDDEQGKRMLGFAVVFKIANPAWSSPSSLFESRLRSSLVASRIDNPYQRIRSVRARSRTLRSWQSFPPPYSYRSVAATIFSNSSGRNSRWALHPVSSAC
jgi:hypothetical protein